MVTLDFGAPTLKSSSTLALSGDNFRRRVTVEGRGRRDPEWVTIVDQALRLRGAARRPRARYETIALPENNHQLLRVTVFHGPDDPGPHPDPRRLGRGRGAPPAARGAASAARITRAEDARARETILTLDLGARHQPFRGIVLDVADSAVLPRRGRRGAGRPAAGRRPGPPLAWTFLCEGAIYRYEADGEVREVAPGGRGGPGARAARAHPQPRRRAAARSRGVTVMAPVERLAFEAAPGRRYRLDLRRSPAPAPAYDLARTVGDPALFAARAPRGRAGRRPSRRAGAEAAAALDGAPPRAALGRPGRGGRWRWAPSPGGPCARREPRGANIRCDATPWLVRRAARSSAAPSGPRPRRRARAPRPRP